jgi:dienelactone hydrolase
MKKLIFSLLLVLIGTNALAQSWVKVNYDTGAGTTVEQVEAVIRTPEGTPNGQALLILHHAGGFGMNTTQQYGDFFSKRGFVTLELKMFQDNRNRPSQIALHGQMMGGLKYLAQLPSVDPKKVSALGMSMGAIMATNATSTWFYENYKGGDLRFNKLIALYPVCWISTEAAKGQTQEMASFVGMPNTFFQKWASIPLLILAAGKDSYDSLDPTACPTFVKSISDPKQAEITRVVVYPDATHGWDHGRDYSFPVRGACTKRTNCTNRIVHSPETVELGKQAALSFLTEK